MARRKLEKYLINEDDITEQLRPIDGSETDYISNNGNIYKKYGNNKWFPKKNSINNVNGYMYCGITYPDGQRSRRVHVLVAEAWLPKPNEDMVVMHLDNDKTNNNVSNLKWGTIAENTRSAFQDGLVKNDSGWEDSQSIPVCVFNEDYELVKICGSIGEAYNETGVTKAGIVYQCEHHLRTKPRKHYYFRYYSEYQEKGFVL